uniref:Gag-Pol polyprotein n=1 Tax=Tanacetum cinerariifolium TaxID=118510 RepID=A0A6L2MSL0_TANCI|nr:Gag-Pol polyprotein [Tanacetum cinerariifolium]
MSKKQNCTAMSLREAEYVALSASCAQVMWMRTQLQDYGFNYNKILLYCNSQSSIAISCNPVQHTRTKNIHTRYYFIKEQANWNEMFDSSRTGVLRYDGDECNKGRILTKIELALEQSQQGVSNDVLVSIEGVEELKRNVWIKGENKAARHTLKAEIESIHMLSVFTKVNSDGNPLRANIKQALGSLIPVKSDSSPHVHAQTTKTYQPSRFKNQESSNSKTNNSTNSDKQDLPSRNQVYQGRLLASFQDDAKYKHDGQNTRSQGGKDDQDKRIKI